MTGDRGGLTASSICTFLDFILSQKNRSPISMLSWDTNLKISYLRFFGASYLAEAEKAAAMTDVDDAKQY